MPSMAFSRSTEWDRYGGWKTFRFQPTGYFRTERKNGRWWFVTPEGNAWLALGACHVFPGMINAPYNQEYWWKELGITDSTSQEEADRRVWKMVKDTLPKIGMNHVGCGASPEVNSDTVPYIAKLRFRDIAYFRCPQREKFPDVFSPAYRKHVQAIVDREVVPRKNDPYCMGYYFVDAPVLLDDEARPYGISYYSKPKDAAFTWPRALRNMSADAPGKRAYVACMRDIYANDIKAFNKTYLTDFSSFKDLLKAVDWRIYSDSTGNSLENRDNVAILVRILDKCWKIETDAIREADPNHLIFGDKLQGNTPDIPKEVLKMQNKYFDVFYFVLYANWYDTENVLDRFKQFTDKPLFNADSCWSVPTREMPNPIGIQCATQEIRAKTFEDYALKAFARPEFVGFGWCSFMDRWEVAEKDKQHTGIVDPFGVPHQPLANTLKRLSRKIYEVH